MRGVEAGFKDCVAETDEIFLCRFTCNLRMSVMYQLYSGYRKLHKCILTILPVNYNIVVRLIFQILNRNIFGDI